MAAQQSPQAAMPTATELTSERVPQQLRQPAADATITLPPPSPLPATASVGAAASKGGGGVRPSSKFGTVNYSVDEMRRLVAKVRAVMPVGGDDWLHVAYQFNYLRPEAIPYREAESLKRKFKKMYCSRGARLPAYIEEAKELRRLLSLRAAAAPEPKVELESEQLPPPAGSVVTTTAAVTATAHRKQGNAGDDDDSARLQTANSALSDACAVASRLSAMEDEYRRAVALRRTPRDEGFDASESNGGAVSAAASAAASQLLHSFASDPPPSAVAALDPPPAHSTSGIIAMLQQSVERKRRSAEEQALSESERVRKERKKRKMEQVLYSIHREQRERELHDPAASAGHVATASAATTGPAPFTTPTLISGACDTSATGMMELVLQFLTAQQRENVVRLQQEQERRERKHRIKEQRRREKERRRRQETRELMHLMAAAMGDKFPDALRHHLVATPSSSDSEGNDDGDEENEREHNGDTSSSSSATSAPSFATGSVASRDSGEVLANGGGGSSATQQQVVTTEVAGSEATAI